MLQALFALGARFPLTRLESSPDSAMRVAILARPGRNLDEKRRKKLRGADSG